MPTCPTPLQTPIPSRTSFFCTLLEVGPFASPAVTHQRPADGRLRRFTLATPGGLERDRIVVEGHRADVVWTALVGVAVPTVAAVGRKDVDVGRLEGGSCPPLTSLCWSRAGLASISNGVLHGGHGRPFSPAPSQLDLGGIYSSGHAVRAARSLPTNLFLHGLRAVGWW